MGHQPVNRAFMLVEEESNPKSFQIGCQMIPGFDLRSLHPSALVLLQMLFPSTNDLQMSRNLQYSLLHADEQYMHESEDRA